MKEHYSYPAAGGEGLGRGGSRVRADNDSDCPLVDRFGKFLRLLERRSTQQFELDRHASQGWQGMKQFQLECGRIIAQGLGSEPAACALDLIFGHRSPIYERTESASRFLRQLGCVAKGSGCDQFAGFG